MTSTATLTHLIAAVREHAELHYNESGWDYVVECYSDEDLAEEIGKARTVAGAIRNVKRVVSVRAERRREVQNEIF